MTEIVHALRVIADPLIAIKDAAVVEPLLMIFRRVINFWSRNALDTSFGHFIIRVGLNPALVWMLSQGYFYRSAFKIFGNITTSQKIVLSAVTDLFQSRLLSMPVKQVISNIAIVYADVMFGPLERENMRMFFYIGDIQGDTMIGRYMATGDVFNTRNCFYSVALTDGIQRVENPNETNYNVLVRRAQLTISRR